MTRSIILLSGGLDSVVSLALCKEKYNVTFALTFDYGQKSAEQEIKACKKICEYYNLQHKVIKLDWLKEITHTALVDKKNLPSGIQKNSTCPRDFCRMLSPLTWISGKCATSPVCGLTARTLGTYGILLIAGR